ncbi:MAG TPA: flagellar export chaperone FliS [Bacillota bacterium]|nr:flagellar export chaperone FliS [Bacillota bacterium]
MTMNQAYQAYQENAVNTASGGELTLMLYNGCIKFIKQAEKSIQQKNFAKKNEQLQKAQKIIQELMVTLDQEIEISKQLFPLYEYIYYLLTQVNIHNDLEKLNEALEYVAELRDTWVEVIKKTRQQKVAQERHV